MIGATQRFVRRWLHALFAPANLAPILVRGRLEDGVLPHRVDVQVTWLPSKVTRSYSGSGAQGLCLVPWYRDSSQAVMDVRADGARGEIAVRAGQTAYGRAFDVQLEASVAPEARVFSA